MTAPNSQQGRVRVILFLRSPETGPDQVHEAYHQISTELSATPGMLANELLHSILDGESFAVLSEWRDIDAFQAWEQGPSHQSKTSPLRPYQDRGNGRHYGIYQVVASY